MNVRPAALLVLLVCAMIAALFTFSSAYLACSEQFTAVTAARQRLDEDCDNLCDLVPRVSAFAYQCLPNVQRQVITTELAQARLGEHRSPSDMARAFDLLNSSLSNLMVALDASTATTKRNYADLRGKIDTALDNVLLARTDYNAAADRYNTAISQPHARCWQFIIRFLPAEPFAQQRQLVKQPIRPTRPTPTPTPRATGTVSRVIDFPSPGR